MELTHEFEVGVPIETAWAVLTDVERIAPCMPGAELQEVEGDEFRGVVRVKVGPITTQYRGKARFAEISQPEHHAVLKAEGRETRGQGSATATIDATLQARGDATNVTLLTDLAITGRVAQFGRGVLADVTGKLLGEFVQCLEATVLHAHRGDSGAAVTQHEQGAQGEPGTSGQVSRRGAQDAPSRPSQPDDAMSGASAAGTATGEVAGATDGAAGGTASPATAEGGPVRAGASAGPPRRAEPAEPAAPVDLLEVAGRPVAKRAVPVLAAVAAVVIVVSIGRRRRRK